MRNQGQPLRREVVQRAAAELFREKGFAATTVRDLARRLGVTGAALYRYVKGKDDLLYRIMDQAMSLGERRLEEALGGDGTVEERLRRLIHHHVLAGLEESPAAMGVFFQEIGLLQGARWRKLDERRRRYQASVVSVFRDAVDRGIIDTPDVRVTAYGVLGLGNWLHRWYRRDRGLGPEDLARHYTDMVLDGLRPRAPGLRPRRGPGDVRRQSGQDHGKRRSAAGSRTG